MFRQLKVGYITVDPYHANSFAVAIPQNDAVGLRNLIVPSGCLTRNSISYFFHRAGRLAFLPRISNVVGIQAIAPDFDAKGAGFSTIP